MNEQLFLKQLSIQLKGLPEEDIEEIIEDYASYFSEARKNGLTEEETVKNLGHPLDIVKEIKASRKQEFSARPAGISQPRSLIVAFGLIFFNLIVVLGPVIGVIGGFFGIFVSCVAFIISPLLTIGSIIFLDGHLFDFFFSIVLCGIGILVLPYLGSFARKGKDVLQKYIEWNVNVVKGEDL